MATSDELNQVASRALDSLSTTKYLPRGYLQHGIVAAAAQLRISLTDDDLKILVSRVGQALIASG